MHAFIYEICVLILHTICIYSLFIFLLILDFKATSFGSSHFSDFGTRRGGGHGCQHSIEFFQLDAHVPENWLNIIQIIHRIWHLWQVVSNLPRPEKELPFFQPEKCHQEVTTTYPMDLWQIDSWISWQRFFWWWKTIIEAGFTAFMENND